MSRREKIGRDETLPAHWRTRRIKRWAMKLYVCWGTFPHRFAMSDLSIRLAPFRD
jgi:hypothetical protein